MLPLFFPVFICLPGQALDESRIFVSEVTGRTAVVVEEDILVPVGIAPRSSYGNTPWPGGLVPYEFDASVTLSQQQIAREIMDQWEARADVTFLPRTTQADYVVIITSSTNSSYVGTIGGAQDLNMVSWGTPIVFAHELAHALGIWHEQSRADRDCYVSINYGNIQSGFSHNFDIRSSGADVGPYDFESMMHYSPTAFSVCGLGCNTIEVQPQYGLWESTLGQRSFISEGDARGVGAVYGFSANDCNENHIADSFEIAQGGADCNNNGTPDNCEIDCNGNGIPDDCDLSQGSSFDTNFNNVPDECDGIPEIVHVDSHASGANTGTTWNDALTDLQDALNLARNAPGVVREIWVAEGVYRAGTMREESFELTSNLEILGGFAGDETDKVQRNPTRHVSLLDGDLLGDDGPAFANRSDNSYNVVTAAATVDESCLLDGFWIRGGNADALFSIFESHHAGGGLHCGLDARPRIRDCVFFDNEAGVHGGGGGVYTRAGDPVLANCRFVGNRALAGGGVFADFSFPLLVNCVFHENLASLYFGGGMAASHGGPWLANCTFYDNHAMTFGGGYAHNSVASPPGASTLRNCILWMNSDGSGIGETAQLDENVGALFVDWSCIQGWNGIHGGSGNMGLAPRFAAGPLGDFRLRRQSPCIDAGSHSKLPPDRCDLDRDGNFQERFSRDAFGKPRVAPHPSPPLATLPARIDMGAIESRPLVRDSVPHFMSWE